MSPPIGYCAIYDCPRTTEDGRSLCDAHRKRLQRTGRRGGPIRSPVASQLEGLLEAGIALVEVDSEDDQAWQRALDALQRQALRYAAGVTMRTPEDEEGPP